MNDDRRLGRTGKILRDVRRDWWLYVMLIPGLAFITVFHYVPMYGVTIAFKNYSIFKALRAHPGWAWKSLRSCLPAALSARR